MNATSEKIRVMVVDDHFVVRMGLCGSINFEADMMVETEATTGEQAIDKYRQHQPDVVLMDLKLPGISGIEATRTICGEFPSAAVVMLSTYESEEDIYNAIQAGARTYLLKSASRSELIGAIRSVHAGEHRVSLQVGAHLAERMRRPHLTPREKEVLGLIAKGRSNKEIAAELAITTVTVKLHVVHLLSKLRVSDRTQATTTALQRGLVHLD
ncbi:MAG TPA: response regulator transcription factor [Verrucomicrobiae bacterium]|jgi:two-component system NarL family response regulator|nr:response regulator transcription factor [Verrucomicrobiae bacterium]